MAVNRDVMVNTAVTVVPRINGVHLMAEKDVEVCQYAFELHAKKLPWPERHVKRALEEQMNMILEKMRRAGLVRP